MDAAVTQPAGAVTDPLPGVELDGTVVRRRRRAVAPRAPSRWQRLKFPLTIYLVTKVVYGLIVVVDHFGHSNQWSMTTLVTNWDGIWYDALAHYGYPQFDSHLQTTLGFLPLYSMLMLALSHVIPPLSNADAGLIISGVGGFIATVLVGRLADCWWNDERISKQVMVFFCVFPGSIVFSMVYSEGVLIPLIAGCLLAVEHRRWFTAGCCAACATAVAPVAVAIIPALALTAAVTLWRAGRGTGAGAGLSRYAVVRPVLRGLRDRAARSSLYAPIMAPIGLGAFAIYLWAWTGTPMASYDAQRYGWGEKSTPLAFYNQCKHAIVELVNWQSWSHPGVNMNYDAGALGGFFLITAIVLILRRDGRSRLSVAAIVWTLWVAIETLTSYNTPPNPRLLLCAFPALMIVAAKVKRTGFIWLISVSSILLVLMSYLTFYGTSLRP